jgi:putative phosphoesterase
LHIDNAHSVEVSNKAIMLIGLISDTHIPFDVKELPELSHVFHGVDLILHAGDIYQTYVLDQLEEIAPVLAASGDDDYGETLTDHRVRETHVLTIDGVTIWLFHEYRYSNWYKYEKLGKQAWVSSDNPPDVIVYGHFHRPDVKEGEFVLGITPGSATFPNYKHEPGTVGLLSIESGKSSAQIVQLS